MKDISQTILSQYAASPILCTLIDAWNQALDPSTLIDNWYAWMFNVQTAQGYGLDVWGRIVGVTRVLALSSGDYLGFSEASDLTEEGFDAVPWYSGDATTENFALTDDAFRQLIYAKALANISNNSITALNAILMTLFGPSGEAYVQDNADMSMVYVFDFTPSSAQIAIIQSSGVLPRPAGVSLSYKIASSS